jgi:hypothetical protein
MGKHFNFVTVMCWEILGYVTITKGKISNDLFSEKSNKATRKVNGYKTLWLL